MLVGPEAKRLWLTRRGRCVLIYLLRAGPGGKAKLQFLDLGGREVGHTAVMGIGGGGRVDNLCPELYATCLVFILFMD